MNIDIIDFGRQDASLVEALLHHAMCAVSIGMGRSDMIGVGCHAYATQFTVNARSPCLGMLVFFEHQNTCTFTQDKSIAVHIKGTAGAFMALNPPIPASTTAASAPPASMRSAIPLRMSMKASAIQLLDVAQAETVL